MNQQFNSRLQHRSDCAEDLKTNIGMQFSLLVAILWSELMGVCYIFETIAKKMVR